jgi:hypothetical protein
MQGFGGEPARLRPRHYTDPLTSSPNIASVPAAQLSRWHRLRDTATVEPVVY